MKILLLFIILIYTLNASDSGKLFFSGNCATCHSKIKSISAPSINEIRNNYLNAFPNEENFVEYMTTWVLNPDSKTSIMQSSIKKYELMPELGYEKYTLEEIAKYIYRTDFSKQH